MGFMLATTFIAAKDAEGWAQTAAASKNLSNAIRTSALNDGAVGVIGIG